MTRIAVLADLHAMRATTADALAAARREGFDVLLILGDLLTYGVEPAATLDLVADAVARDGAILVAGNHDQIYRDVAGEVGTYRAALTDWLRETIDWTLTRIAPDAMQAFDWQEAWACGPLFAAHANPGAFGDWTYVSDDAQADAAAAMLAARGYRYGVFGHSHRARRFDRAERSLFTVRSLGQPRDDRDRQPGWTMIELGADTIAVEPRPVPFDSAAHIAAIRATALSSPTQDRLCRFYA